MLKIHNLSKTFYPGTTEEHQVFDNFSIEIEQNTCTTILGPNGCGKSTLMNLISGSLKADGGRLELNGEDFTNLSEEKRASFVGKVSQDPSMGVSPSLTILENMSVAVKKGSPFTFRKLLKHSDIDFLVEKLKELDLGLENKLSTQVKFLSGGQRQSLSLLMATIKRPDLLLLDEHTAALDPKTSKLVMDKTRDLIQREKITTLMITHNLSHALAYSKRILMLNKGELVLDVLAEDITEKELNQLYHENILQDLQGVA